MATKQNKAYNIFISYAHEDAPWRDRFLVHLAPLTRNGLVDTWTDQDIQASENWAEKIENALDCADIGLLLVSHAAAVLQLFKCVGQQ